MNPLSKKHTCIIISSAEADRNMISCLLKQYTFIEVLGVFGYTAAASEFIQRCGSPDVVLLDIDVPGAKGLLNELSSITTTIFIGKNQESAMECFELSALDYLIKPLLPSRFERMMAKLERVLENQHKAVLLDQIIGGDSLFVKDGHNHVKLQLHEIIYLEALKDYTGIITRNRRYLVGTSLGALLQQSEFQRFLRIHRSYAIQKYFVDEVSARGILINERLLPVSRTYRPVVQLLLRS